MSRKTISVDEWIERISRADAENKRGRFTAEEDRFILELHKRGVGPAAITRGFCKAFRKMGRTGVSERLARLKEER